MDDNFSSRDSEQITTLSHWLGDRLTGPRPALLVPDGEDLTADALSFLLENAGSSLKKAGLGADQTVALLMAPGPTMLLGCLSVMSQCMAVPLDPDLGKTMLIRRLSDLEPDCILVPADFELPPWLRETANTLNASLTRVHLDGVSLSFPDLQEHQSATLKTPSNDDVALVLHTSGSTGKPKQVPLTHEKLLFAAGNVALSLGLTADDRCVNAMPAFHVGALVDLLLAPLSVGSQVVLAAPFNPYDFKEVLEAYDPTWFQAVPTMLAALLDTGPIPALPRLKLIRSVSSTLPVSLAEKVEAVFDCAVIEIYGMSETAGLITSNPLPPAPRKAGSVGKPVGTRVRIMGEDGCSVPAGVQGEIHVHSPGIMKGYQGSDGVEFYGEWFPSGDEGYLDDEGYLFLCGRIKESINRGGEKISPLEIDSMVQHCGGIKEAAAFALPHPTLGEEVALAVVPDYGSCLEDTSLRRTLKNLLPAIQNPRRIVYLSALPRAAGGKLQRHQLAAMVGEESVRQRDLAETHRDQPADLATLWSEVLSLDWVHPDDNFFDLGGDSLRVLMLVTRVREQLGKPVSAAQLYENPTLSRFCASLNRDEQGKGTAVGNNEGIPALVKDDLRALLAGWKGRRLDPECLLVGLNTSGSRPPLFWCINGYEELQVLAQALGPEQPIYGMRSLYQVPGREERFNPALADRYLEEIFQIQPTGAYRLGGYCEGAKIGFLIAQAMKAQKKEVTLLALQDQFVASPYSGAVTMFVCTPAPGAPQPWGGEENWRRYYQGKLDVITMPFGHLDCYQDSKALQFFAIALTRALGGKGTVATISSPTAVLHEVLPQQKRDYRVEITGKLPLVLLAGSTLEIAVRLRNISSEIWSPSMETGIMLGGRWKNWQGKYRGQVTCYGKIPCRLKPGASVVLTLIVTVPEINRFRYFEIDLVKDGVIWFGMGIRCPVMIVKSKLAGRKSKKLG